MKFTVRVFPLNGQPRVIEFSSFDAMVERIASLIPPSRCRWEVEKEDGTPFTSEETVRLDAALGAVKSHFKSRFDFGILS